MKALMGELVITIRNDQIGKDELKKFISNTSNDKIITLTNGKQYKFSSNKPIP